MKKLIKNQNKALGIFLLALSMSLFSFSSLPGGDYFEIFINSKLVHKQFLHGDKAIHTVAFNEARPNDQIKVTYSHCGRLGMDRKVIIKDENNKILKQWNYANGTTTSKYLTFKIKEIIPFQKENAIIQLVYVSRELPEGHVLAKIRNGGSIAKK